MASPRTCTLRSNPQSCGPGPTALDAIKNGNFNCSMWTFCVRPAFLCRGPCEHLGTKPAPPILPTRVSENTRVGKRQARTGRCLGPVLGQKCGGLWVLAFSKSLKLPFRWDFLHVGYYDDDCSLAPLDGPANQYLCRPVQVGLRSKRFLGLEEMLFIDFFMGLGRFPACHQGLWPLRLGIAASGRSEALGGPGEHPHGSLKSFPKASDGPRCFHRLEDVFRRAQMKPSRLGLASHPRPELYSLGNGSRRPAAAPHHSSDP